MDVATRNRYREIEYAGGIYGVATLPGFTRKGVSMTLMDRAHQYFQMKGYRFSFLVTNHALVAHSLYVKLGYSDLLVFPNAYKVVKSSGTKSTVKGIVRGLNFDRILSIYDKFTENKTGLVVRDIQYLKMLRKVEGLKAKQCLIGKNGYVIFRQDKSGIWIRELVALNTKGTDELLSVIENQSKGLVYDRMILDDTLLSVYRAREYMIHQRSHSVMMLKTLAPGASFEKTYGDSFFMTRLDGF
jgi:predicted acetyltransferase